MAPTIITESEILDTLAKAAGPGPKNARTVRELEAKMGISHQLIRKALRVFQRGGRLAVHRAYRLALDGSYRHVPAYTILPQKKK